MIKLSVNVNKVATIRNSRGGSVPSVLDAAGVAVDAGAHGITVHPRADARHITFADVEALADVLLPLRGRVEFNIEGDPRPELLDLVRRVRPDQCTLVPVAPGEVDEPGGMAVRRRRRRFATSWTDLKSAWRPSQPVRRRRVAGGRLGGRRWAATASSCTRSRSRGRSRTARPRRPPASVGSREAARHAHDRGLGVNAGHDLDLDNLVAVPRAAAPGRSLDRPRPHQPCDVRRPRADRPRIRRRAGGTRGVRFASSGHRCRASVAAQPGSRPPRR